MISIFFFSHVETSVSPEAITPAVVEFFFFLLISVLSVHLSAGLNSVQFQARRTMQECPGRQNSFYDFLLLFLIINILCCPQNNGSINSSVLKDRYMEILASYTTIITGVNLLCPMEIHGKLYESVYFIYDACILNNTPVVHNTL